MSHRLFALATFLSIAALTLPAVAAEPPVLRGAEVIGPVAPHVFTGDLRELPRARPWQPGDPVKEIPRRHRLDPGELPLDFRSELLERPAQDPLLELQERAVAGSFGEALGSPILDLPGQGYSGVNPPDTVGEVGKRYYVQMINGGGGTLVRFHSKATGAIAAGPFTLDDLGSGNCANGLGDPVVLWDEPAQRWLFSEFSLFGNRLCVYVSRSDEPLVDGWYAYEFTATNFPDYPKYAVWPDAYYVSSNESLPAAYALERGQMLIGAPASLQRFTAPELGGFGFQTMTPSDLDGTAEPPAGSPGIFVRHRDDEAHDPGQNDPNRDALELFEFAVDWADPASSTFTGPIPIAIAEIDSNMCGLFTFSCFDQPGGADLDPLREVVMWRSQYRNVGTHEVLVGNLVTDVSVDQGGVRWYELRRSGGGAWSLHQEGTYGPDGDNRWMGSAAMDSAGNLAIGYNVSSTSTFPALRYVGRLASDPPGSLPQGELSLVEGSGSNSSNRYGDYSSLNLDPADGCTYWLTGEYNTSSNWSTRIGTFRFDECATTYLIESITPGQAGVVNTWAIAGAAAGATVELFCRPLPVGGWVSLGTATADAAGDAELSRSVPATAGGRTVECYAETVGSLAFTPVVAVTFE